jgi:hypothetical protein
MQPRSSWAHDQGPRLCGCEDLCDDKGPGALVTCSCGYQGPMEVTQHCHGYKSGAPGLQVRMA